MNYLLFAWTGEISLPWDTFVGRFNSPDEAIDHLRKRPRVAPYEQGYFQIVNADLGHIERQGEYRWREVKVGVVTTRTRFWAMEQPIFQDEFIVSDFAI